MGYNIKHEMTIEDVDNKLKILSHLVDDEFVKVIEEARKYLIYCYGMKEKMENYGGKAWNGVNNGF